MNKKIYIVLGVIVLVTVFNLALVYYIFQYKGIPGMPNVNLPEIFKLPDLTPPKVEGVAKFADEEEFKTYLSKTEEQTSYYYGNISVDRGFALEESVSAPSANLNLGMDKSSSTIGLGTTAGIGGGDSAGRVSETNVQVVGIDEPDIVKTDGKEIYYSSSFYPYYRDMPIPVDIQEEKPSSSIDRIMPPQPRNYNVTKTIKAWPPADLKVDGEIARQGNLLIKDNILMVFEYNNVYGYDVSNPASPAEKWKINLEDRNSIAAARLYGDKVYLVVSSYINRPKPCPYIPLKFNDKEFSIACTDIYHPINPLPTDSTYSIMEIDPKSGEVKDNVSFVASGGNSVIYMSEKSVFVTYYYPGDFIGYIFNFFKENEDIVPEWLITKLAKLNSYDISDNAKMTEFSSIMEEFITSLNEDEALKMENEMTNRMDDFSKKHKRDLEQTGIVKIAVDGLNVTANGNVPGIPLNQFALDEYNDNLRVATTTGGNRSFGMFNTGSSESVNDVYVMDKDLKQIGSVLDMGLTERIYSVRFIQDKGYVVTFRQTDPFYVLDLSNPQKPEKKGELKIPGYSSYLHPITKDKILGIGEESGKVKISLFDVSNPSDPKEIDKYSLDEYWTEVANTHHAFLLDDKHQVFFLPGSKGGYVFGYANDKLKLERAVSSVSAQRAIYLDDYMYIIGQNNIVVLNEKDWQEVNKLSFD